ncbi:MAG: calcium-binding protein [Cyanobacteria bacterium J06633_8]
MSCSWFYNDKTRTIALENISDIELITQGNSPSFIIVEPGATQAKLMFTGIPDGVPEGEELSGFTILEGDGYTIDSNQSSANIIITDLPIVSLSAEPTNVNEGEQLKFNFELTEAAPSGGLTVNLDLVEDTDPLPGDITYFVEGSENITDFNLIVNDDSGLIDGATVTIAEGATSATLLNDIIADNNTEGPESVKFSLADGEYSIDSEDNAASFTIVDTSVGGSAIAIVNPGFEIPQLPENQFTQTSLGEFLPGWKVFDPDALIGENVTDVGAYNPITNVFPSEAPEGENTGYAYSQAPVGSGIFGLTQTLDTQLKANTKYTLQVEVGNAAENDPDDGFNYEGFPGYRVELLAGGKVLARDDNSLSIAEGEFATSTVNFTATETEAFLGQDLGIRLVNLLGDSGEDVEFDNVKLFAQTVDNPVVKQISGTTKDDNLYGTNAAEIISGGRGDDNISGNGGGDTLIGGRGDDDIYGSSDAETIEGGRGDDIIYANGGDDLINSGFGLDTVYLGSGEATVILDKGEGFDTIFNFQLGSTKLEVSSLDNLNFTDSDSGAEIFLEGDKLAVVAGQSAHTFSSNQDSIFAV